METSLFSHPGFLVPFVAGCIALIAWAIRVEMNGKKTSDSLDELWNDLHEHKEKPDIHFNKGVAEQVERRQSERMDRMQTDISEIKTMVKELKANK